MTEDVIAEMQRSGCGLGRMGSYVPWVHILSFYSEGRTHEPFSHRFGGRTHQLLSDGEKRAFTVLEWARDVIDVREQYPLPREITLEVAHSLGIKHQYYPGTHLPYVMSLDFLVDRVKDGKTYLQAINVKTADELEDPDVINELEIARATCEGMDIEHHLFISERLDASQKIKNLEWIRDAQLDEYATEPFPGFFEEHMSRMAADIRARQHDVSLSDYCSGYDRRYSVERGIGMRVARMLLQSRALTMDLNNVDPQMAHMSSYHLSARPGQLQSVGGQ
jgi:hypothetical protein